MKTDNQIFEELKEAISVFYNLFSKETADRHKKKILINAYIESKYEN